MEDRELWDAFSSLTLPHEQWTHRAHLRIAWMFLKRHPLDEAHVLMRVGIVRLNASHGLVETAVRGYHDTITRVWLALIRESMKTTRAETSDVFIDACGDRLGKDALLRHYSCDRLMSVQARAIFVEPDLLPLEPIIATRTS